MSKLVAKVCFCMVLFATIAFPASQLISINQSYDESVLAQARLWSSQNEDPITCETTQFILCIAEV